MIPTITAPTYEVKLQSVSKPVAYRPFLVKEEKLLLMAQQGEDIDEIERTVKQVIKECTFGKVDVDALPSFDLELLFLQLRAKSINNVVELRYECKNKKPEAELPLDENDDGICHKLVKCEVNLDNVKITVPEGHTRKFLITDKVGCVMRYPTSKHLRMFRDTNETDAVSMIADCIEAIYDTDGTVYETKDSTPQEVVAFVESLSLAQVNKFRAFFETLPHVEHSFEFKCPACGYTEEITLKGLLDFFD
jgi:hypothetical protein